jgi:hypothetical protein
MLLAVLLAEIVLIVRAWRAARFSPRHRYVPALIACAFVTDVSAYLIQRLMLRGEPRPFTGLARLAYHVETAMVVGWPTEVALFGLWVFLPRRWHRTRPVVLWAWAGAVAYHVLAYPLSRLATRVLFVGAELVAVAVVVGAAIRAYGQRRWGSLEGVALFLAGTEVVVTILGPYATNPFTDWDVARAIYFAAFVGMVAWYSARPHP